MGHAHTGINQDHSLSRHAPGFDPKTRKSSTAPAPGGTPRAWRMCSFLTGSLRRLGCEVYLILLVTAEKMFY
jgi:hypothetical protein